jgi:hypothetical protein
MKELYAKKIYPSHLSGSSAGAIFPALIACVRSPEKSAEILESVQGDKIMKWAGDIEFKRGNGFTRFLKSIGVLFLTWWPIKSMERIFARELTWKKARLNGVRHLAIGVVKESDVVKTVGKDIFKYIKKYGLEQFLENKFEDSACSSYSLIKDLPMYFFCEDGIYSLSSKYMKIYQTEGIMYKKELNKISSKTIPLHKAVLASFTNPLLPSVKIKFDKWFKKRAFDGGIANNHANVAMIGHDDFMQVSCGSIPGKLTGKEMGIGGISKIYYNIHRSSKEKVIKSDVKYKGFFGFYDENIREYLRERATNYWPLTEIMEG